jgi:hypothetical protein
MNGKTGELLRWIAGLVLSGVIAYYTAIGSIQARIGVVEERENNHYSEVLRINAEMRRQLERIESKMDDDRRFRLGPQP